MLPEAVAARVVLCAPSGLKIVEENKTAQFPAVDQMRPMLVVTGMSGAGRSTAAKVLEDLGY